MLKLLPWPVVLLLWHKLGAPTYTLVYLYGFYPHKTLLVTEPGLPHAGHGDGGMGGRTGGGGDGRTGGAFRLCG